MWVSLLFFASKTSGEEYALEEPLLDFLNEYCVSCHNPDKKKGKLDIESLLGAGIDQHFEVWDEVAWMLREREMPPEDEEDVKRPQESEFDSVAEWLEGKLMGLSDEGVERDPIISSKHGLINQYCVSCHNPDERKGDLVLEGISLEDRREF